MAGKYWREAATLMLIGKKSSESSIKNLQCASTSYTNLSESDISKNQYYLDGSKIMPANYDILCMKRSAKSSFMPSNYVFPGGAIDDADKSMDWLSILNGHCKQDIISKFKFNEGRPFLYSNKPPQELLPELAFRICALRETFEETGILLASSGSTLIQVDDFDREEWRLLIQKDPKKFLELFKFLQKVPAIFNLYEWDGWLTPTSFKGLKRRFDTAFYIAFLDAEIPFFGHNKEAEEIEIETPFYYLDTYYNKRSLNLGPPQLCELGRLLNINDYDNLKKYSTERAKINLPRWLPVHVAAKNGIISSLPGDDLYPMRPDFIGLEETKTIDLTVEESKSSCSNLNRFVIRPNDTALYFCNNSHSPNHLIPLLPLHENKSNATDKSDL